MNENTEWYLPSLLALDKHVKYYRDLSRSTEKVELTMAHAGKRETFDNTEVRDVSSSTKNRYPTINVTLREELDPRLAFRSKQDNQVRIPNEFKDWKLIQLRLKDDKKMDTSSVKADAIAALTLAKRQQLLQSSSQWRPESPKRVKRSAGWE